jgi:hypothetical protein
MNFPRTVSKEEMLDLISDLFLNDDLPDPSTTVMMIGSIEGTRVSLTTLQRLFPVVKVDSVFDKSGYAIVTCQTVEGHPFTLQARVALTELVKVETSSVSYSIPARSEPEPVVLASFEPELEDSSDSPVSP